MKYKKGSTNHVADCLSRPLMAVLATIFNSYGHETSKWPQLYTNGSDFGTAYQTLSAYKAVPKFHLHDGFLCHLSHLCVPSSEHAKLIWEAHYNRVVRQFGVEKTMIVLQYHFYWLKLRQDVRKYIRSCTTKPTIKKHRLYTPLPTPNRPWESISMDYMSNFPSTKHGNDSIFMVVDRFSKMAVLTPCKKSITTEATTKLFFTHVWVHFGLPRTIISDRDSRFLSNF
jgi:hypothetical protein